MDSQNNGNDQFERDIDKASQAFSKGAQKVGGKALSKIKEKIKEKTKKAMKAIKKQAAKIIVKLVLWIGWPALAIFGLILIIAAAFAISNSSSKDNVDVYFNSVYKIAANWKERLDYSFYAYYSDHSYYYYVDGEKELKQAGFDENQPQDKEGKESSFALSAGFLKFLDEELNKNHKMPEQFIKPIFNTCTGTDASNCKLKQLTDKDDKVVAKSQYFDENKCKKGDKKCIANTWKPKDEKEERGGIWDYGFAPILHYAKKQDKTWVENYRVTNIRYFDEKDNKYKTCSKKSDCEEAWEEVNNHETAKKYIGKKTDEKTTDVYLIDSVATFVGDVNTQIQEETKDTGADVTIPAQIKKVKDSKRIITDETNLTSKKTKETLEKQPSDKDDSYTYYVNVYTEKRALITVNGFYNAEILKTMANNGTSLVDEIKKLTKTGPFAYDSNKRLYGANTDVKYYTDGKQWSDVIGKNQKNAGDENKDNDEIDFNTWVLSFKQISSKDILSSTNPSFQTQLNSIVGVGIKYTTISETHECESLKVKNKNTLICKTANGGTEKINFQGTAIRTEKGTGSIKEYISVDRAINHTTSYTITGDRWETAWGYKDDGVDVTIKDNGKYVTDYINRYAAYEPTDYYVPEAVNDLLEVYLTNDENEVKSDPDGERSLTILRNLYGENILAESIAEIFSDDEEEEEDVSSGASEGEGIQRTEKYELAKKVLTGAGQTNSDGFIGDIVNEAATTAGISQELFYGMISVESSFNMSSKSKAGAVGLMQIMPNVHTGVKTIIHPTNPALTLSVTATESNLATDPKVNIVTGVALIQGYINQYKGNIYMAVQAYNNGSGNVDKAVRMYASDKGKSYDDVLNDRNDLGWLSELPKFMSPNSDFDYAAKVFGATPADTIEYYYNGKKIKFDVKNLKVGASNSGMSIEEYIKWNVNKDVISDPNNWRLLYLKPQESAKINLKDNKVVYDKDKQYYLWGDENTSQEYIQKVLATYFAEQDNVEVIEYAGGISDAKWREHFASFFSTADSGKLTLKVKAHKEYFGDTPNTPLDDVYEISRGFGAKGVLQGFQYRTEKNKNIELKGKKENQKVQPVSEGTITHITDNTITIRHKNYDKDKMQVETIYSNIKVNSKLKVGDKAKRNTKLGTLEGKEPMYLELLVNDTEEDPSWIIKSAKELNKALQMGKGINPNAIMGANEDTKKMVAYLHAHAEEMEEEFKDDPAKQFDVNNPDFVAQTFDTAEKVTGIAWVYGPGNSTPHDAVDLAPGTTDAGYYAFSDAIIIAYADGYPNSSISDPMAASYAFGLANHSTYLFYGNDGNWYQMTFGHCLTNSLTHLKEYADLPMVEKGARLGTIGNSGLSDGYHTHLTVVKWEGQSLREIANFLAQNVGKFSGYLPANGKENPANRCSNPGKTPCQMAPHEFFGLTYHSVYPGLVPKHD